MSDPYVRDGYIQGMMVPNGRSVITEDKKVRGKGMIGQGSLL
jgi:hypothetical protein